MKVFITGASALVGAKYSIEEIWECQLREEIISDDCLARHDLSTLANLHSEDVSILADYQIMALACVSIAWRKAGLSEYRNRLRGSSKRVSDSRIGCVGGSVLGGLVSFSDDLEGSFNRSPKYSISRWRGNGITSVVSEVFGLAGPTYSLNAASATGGQAIVLAANMIKHGMIDAAIVIASEPKISGPVLEALKNTGSISSNGAVPLSINRSGMRPIHGAACLILESEERVIERKIRKCVEWIDGASGTEIYHLLAPDPTGERLLQLLQDLFREEAAIWKSEIDWVSLHATGTTKFDPIELKIIHSFFRPHKPWLSAFKRTNGHLLSASGVIEAALLAHGINREELPPWPTRTDPSLELEGLRPLISPKPNKAIMISQGMGGTIAVNLFAKAKF